MDKKVAVFGEGASIVARIMHSSFGFNTVYTDNAYTRLIADYLCFEPSFPLCLLAKHYPDIANLVPYGGCDYHAFLRAYKMLHIAHNTTDLLIEHLANYMRDDNPYTRTLVYGDMLSFEKQYFLDGGFELLSTGGKVLSSKHIFTDKDDSVIIGQLLCIDAFLPDVFT